jgi:capsid protein
MLTTHRHLSAKKKFVADRLADEIYTVWLEEWLNAGNLPLPRGFNKSIFYQPFAKECFTACEWIGTGRGQIDELKETQAALLRVKGGLSTGRSRSPSSAGIGGGCSGSWIVRTAWRRNSICLSPRTRRRTLRRAVRP